jgi:hypothetical protein
MKPELEWNLGSAILSLSLCPEMGHGVVTTAKGTVELFSLEDDDAMVAKWRPPFESTVRQSPNCYILSCAMVPYKEEGGGYTIVCGCSDGTMYVQPLNYESIVRVGVRVHWLSPSIRNASTKHNNHFYSSSESLETQTTKNNKGTSSPESFAVSNAIFRE